MQSADDGKPKPKIIRPLRLTLVYQVGYIFAAMMISLTAAVFLPLGLGYFVLRILPSLLDDYLLAWAWGVGIAVTAALYMAFTLLRVVVRANVRAIRALFGRKSKH